MNLLNLEIPQIPAPIKPAATFYCMLDYIIAQLGEANRNKYEDSNILIKYHSDPILMYFIKIQSTDTTENIVFQVEFRGGVWEPKILKLGEWVSYIEDLFKKAQEAELLDHERRYGTLTPDKDINCLNKGKNNHENN